MREAPSSEVVLKQNFPTEIVERTFTISWVYRR